MAAYIVFVLRDVRDRAKLEEYWSKVGPTMAGHVLKPLAAYAGCEVLEGTDTVNGAVIVEFPSMEAARAWYDSPGYREVRQHRLAGADFLTLLVEGRVAFPRKNKA